MTADLGTSAALDRHLKDAIAELSPKKEQATMARGLLRLKNLTESLMQSVDAAAEKAAIELQKDHDEAITAVESVSSHVGGAFKAATSEVNDMLNQISNGDPSKTKVIED
ncbi:hypothetical protein [Bradyrhizobium sp. JYMT SZCCT0428]|uniref:hypothetical protein n=1 Tax=Bradyrhizobium sp. JYMT SZCCT0428 TaxID=2807673 RepID=UPI001BA8C66C|nr:hypothetical protein [Bradyrhizobium sp. JYMT SZCCT0428]MBR1150093.1 hypothetical protein [Bradyrhizobium sp. JYMT SZCCT0428]